jgi:RimJ/RimL family protein N-acetyltransferase
MTLDLQPALTGKLIALRPMRTDDFPALFAAANDPLIWAQHPEPDRYKEDVFRKYFESGIASGGAFVVIERVSGKMIGSSRYYDYKPEAREVKIGFTFLTREFWGGTYNRELKTLMLDHAFQSVRRVLFEVGENNMRSRMAMERIGARLLGKSESEKGVIFEIQR